MGKVPPKRPRQLLSQVGWAITGLWTLLNSPFSIAAVSGVIIAGIARSYSERDAAQKDFENRKDKLATALAEVQQRVSYLQAADALWKGRCDYPKASSKEWEVITGTGAYIPTLPSYRGVHLTVVINDAEKNSGVPDVRAGAAAFLGAFAVPPPRTAWFVRGQLEWLQNYASKRSFLLGVGSLPLANGEQPSDFVNKMLGIPTLEQTQKETNRHAREVIAALEKEPTNNLPPCPEPPTL